MEAVWHDLDGDVAPQLGIAGAIDHAHSARAENRENVVRTDLPPHERFPGVVSHDLRRQFSHRRRKKALRLLRVRKQRLHLLSKRIVVAAGRRDKRGSLALVAVERSVAKMLDTPS